jgi:hypothetical protein
MGVTPPPETMSITHPLTGREYEYSPRTGDLQLVGPVPSQSDLVEDPNVGVSDINGRLVAWFILGLFPGISDAEVDGGSISAW